MWTWVPTCGKELGFNVENWGSDTEPVLQFSPNVKKRALD